MFDKKKLAIIPARGGSKGILKKNIVDLAGKPLIVYSIEAAINSKCFDKICVATDSQEIIDVILFILNYYKNKNEKFDINMLLQPTSPLRTYSDIENAFKNYFEGDKYNSLVSFCNTNEHPYKSFLYEGNEIKPTFGEEYVSMPRQLLPKTIQQNGAIYINRVDDLIINKSFFTGPVYPFIMDELSSIDIDNKMDLLFAEFCLNNNKNNVKA